MDSSEIDDLVTQLDRQSRLLARKLLRSEQALQLLQEIQRGNTNLQRSLFNEIEAEKEKSDRLLRNILPLEAIRRLSLGETLIADSIESATVVFSDLVGFTPASAKMTAPQLVRTLDELYSAFDDAATPADARPRESIEVRTLVLFAEAGEQG